MTILILGGGINRDGTLPKFVKKRLEKAWGIFKTKKDSKILVSGKYSFLFPKDKLPKKTEAEAMRDYLLKLGVPKEKIYLEKKSKDTIGNAYYTKKLYFIPKKEKEAIIVTSDFHLKRVKFIFKKIFGPKYKLKFVGVPSSIRKKAKILKRQKELLERAKEILAPMKTGNHNFLKYKLYKLKYYKEKRKPWVIEFVSEGK
jgi:uncharacterized SAM-binding protein YcdF (DUF218 family)